MSIPASALAPRDSLVLRTVRSQARTRGGPGSWRATPASERKRNRGPLFVSERRGSGDDCGDVVGYLLHFEGTLEDGGPVGVAELVGASEPGSYPCRFGAGADRGWGHEYS